MSSEKTRRIENSFTQNAKVGWYLAKRDIKRANKWTTMLIVAVMTFTFLNLVVVSGILVGLIQGSEDAQKKYAIHQRLQFHARWVPLSAASQFLAYAQRLHRRDSHGSGRDSQQ